MDIIFSPSLRVAIHKAYITARLNRLEFVGIEHLLLALTEEEDARLVLEKCEINLEELKKALRSSIYETVPIVPKDKKLDVKSTLGVQDIINNAKETAKTFNRNYVTGADVLVSLSLSKDNYAIYLLAKQNIDNGKIIAATAAIDVLGGFTKNKEKLKAKEKEKLDTNTNPDPLTQFTLNLNEEARLGRLDPLIGREQELMRMIQILCRRRKNNPLLVGEAGVGKTALAEGLAQMIVHAKDKVPKILQNAQIFSLDIGSLIAGTKYRGDFEGRIKEILRSLSETPNAILFIDEIHMLIGSGASGGGDRTIDGANLLKPALAKGNLHCIGATTYQEYRSIFDSNHALNRRFQKIDIAEPSVEATIEILKGLKPSLESHHNVTYTDESLVAAVKLSQRYLNERFLPDKAIDLLDEAGAAQHLLADNQKHSTIDTDIIETVLAQISRIPIKSISTDDRKLLRNLDASLKGKIFGQDKAIDAICNAVKLSRSGLGVPEKPMGCFLFSGPTGVGKTALARSLAEELGINLIRFDMSEYMESHTISRLIGAPPGYVGSNKGGLLTDEVHKHPYAVLLLDELEKAHPDIFNILLQIMDYGTLTDNNGRRSDFRKIILIMTTNAGAEEISKQEIGFFNNQETRENQTLNRTFSPEFRNRLDEIIAFSPLSRDNIASIVDKFLNELKQQLLEQNVKVTFLANVKKYLIENGFDEKMGARPLSRLIQNTLRKTLADEMLFGQLSNGGSVRVGINTNGEVKLTNIQTLTTYNQTEIENKKPANATQRTTTTHKKTVSTGTAKKTSKTVKK